MPRITLDFDGYTVFINHNDHPPPHFDVRGNGHHCRFAIATGLAMDDSCAMPAATKNKIREWTHHHRNELYVDWRRALRHQGLYAITPPG